MGSLDYTREPLQPNHLIEAEEPIPLVVVEGFLGCGSSFLWGNFREHANHCEDESAIPGRKVIFASVGPVSSLHDRACELFYTLKGGTVDYGREHAETHGHSQFARVHRQGLYPEWSKDKPLHFLGHSLGGPTITKLQWLISTGFFGKSHHPDMIISVTAVSSPFRGTQLVYSLGERTDRPPAVRPLSIGSVLAKSVHLASYFSPAIPQWILDLHAESRHLSMLETSFSSLLSQLRHSDWAEGKDAAPYDVTFEGAEERETDHGGSFPEGLVNPGTFYRSYTAFTSSDEPTNSPSMGHLLSAPALYLSSYVMASFDFATVPALNRLRRARQQPPHLEDTKLSKIIDLKACEENDGIVPVFSQWHPFHCSNTQCRHFSEAKRTSGIGGVLPSPPAPEPGVWHVFSLQNANHLSIAPIWFDTKRQRVFWRDLGRWLREIDEYYHMPRV